MNKKILGVILLIIVIGSGITHLTNEYVVQEERIEETITEGTATPETQPRMEMMAPSVVEISPLEPASTGRNEMAGAMGGDSSLDDGESSTAEASVFAERLIELDAQIVRMKEENTNTTYSLKTMAETELKLWDNERTTVYSAIVNQLDSQASQTFIQQEKDWLKNREQQALEAAGINSANAASYDSIEYMTNLSVLTRQHVYDLVDQFDDILD